MRDSDQHLFCLLSILLIVSANNHGFFIINKIKIPKLCFEALTVSLMSETVISSMVRKLGSLNHLKDKSLLFIIILLICLS